MKTLIISENIEDSYVELEANTTDRDCCRGNWCPLGRDCCNKWCDSGSDNNSPLDDDDILF